MTWQRDRDLGFEEQFAHREEQEFKAAAHRNRLLGRWAAQKMGLEGGAAESYVASLVTGDVAHLRGHGVIDKVIQDLKAAGATFTEVEVRGAFERFDRDAAHEVKQG
ncbi:MAG TPA: DUF1476 domain-containing protein [Candidatus Sulfotelmatobacter sp.]|nr:DUF1476 domain-containing protein [Candidatus Sulfotelmatobacter sp.]